MSTLSVEKNNIAGAKTFLLTKLAEVLEKDVFEELKIVLEELQAKKSISYLSTAFSRAVRLFGKAELQYSSQQREAADKICKDWTPPDSIDKAVRILILLEIPNEDEAEYLKAIESLFAFADVGEQVVIYSALSLFPYPEKLVVRCMEGIRSNMGEVFEAIANDNPFPAAYLSEEAFNQMTLKCLFVGKPLYKIENLNRRLNENLSRMASDYAHERWAAGRELNPELWQLVADFMHLSDMDDMFKLSRSENEMEKKAAALACSQCQFTEAEEIYAMSEYKSKVESGELNWFNLGFDVWRNKD